MSIQPLAAGSVRSAAAGFPRLRRALAAFALAASICSCQQANQTGIRVIARFEPSLAIDQLELTVSPPGTGLTGTPLTALAPGEPGETLADGTRVLLLVADALGGREVNVEVVGLLEGQPRASGSGRVAVEGGAVVDLPIELSVLCASSCPAGDSQCVGEAVRTCQVSSEGCTRWSAPEACPTEQPYCSNGRCAASCVDECAKADEQRCATSGELGRQICGQHDSDSCLDWGPVFGCGAQELCQDGECVPDCGGKPCPCQAGETTACADIGECRGGERACGNDGSLGPCVWATGPTAEVCDGKDNDCNGTLDDNLVAPACSKQLGVCTQSTKRCAGTAGWGDCDAGAYQSHALQGGLVYQTDETECDGQDNDCDGETDEPAACCQPSCAGRQCGPDPVCGSSCGSCPAAEICDSQGQCQPKCTPVGPLTLDSGGDVGRVTSLRVDQYDQVHIAYFDQTNAGLKYATNASGAWKTLSLDAGAVSGAIALDLDQAGKAYIGYSVSDLGIKYATNVSGAWQLFAVDTVGGDLSLAIDGASKLHLAYRDPVNQYLKYATNVSGSLQKTVVDAAGDVGSFPSLRLDGAGSVHVGYYDVGNHDLKYARQDSGGWQPVTVDSANDVGVFASLALDQASKAHLVYYDQTKQDLRYATNESGTWKTFIVDGAGAVGAFSSIALDVAGKAHVSYYDGDMGDLKYATNASGSWVTSSLDTAGTVGLFTSIGIDSHGRIHISYWDLTNTTLKYLALCP